MQRSNIFAVASRSVKHNHSCFRQARPRFFPNEKTENNRAFCEHNLDYILWLSLTSPGQSAFNAVSVDGRTSKELAGSFCPYTMSMRVISISVKQDGRQRIGAQKFRFCGQSLGRSRVRWIRGDDDTEITPSRHAPTKATHDDNRVGQSRRGRWWYAARFDIDDRVFDERIRRLFNEWMPIILWLLYFVFSKMFKKKIKTKSFYKYRGGGVRGCL